MKFRLYIDESGNSDLKASKDPNNRYLSLSGLIINEEYARIKLIEELTNFKKAFFPASYDKVILHRKDIINKSPVLPENSFCEKYEIVS
ncbi:MAG: DUF3800 domain-containing protein [Candidatus Hodarchaeota archaeon]